MILHESPRAHPLITGTLVTSLGTLVCRGLGLLRDMTTAALLGMSQGGVADAFWFAFRLPNLFRQLFGEGAMTASYLPVLTIQLERDPHVARQLATVVVSLLAVFLAALVALGELLFGLVWFIWSDVPGLGLLMGLSAVMLPYLLFICIASQLTTMLYAARHFTVAALTPTMLNIVWLIAAWAVAPGLLRTRWPKPTYWRRPYWWREWPKSWSSCRRCDASGSTSITIGRRPAREWSKSRATWLR